MLITFEIYTRQALSSLYSKKYLELYFPKLGWQENGGVVLKRENPHKYLLYKPTVSQFLVFLASGHKELPPNGALMIYISGDGCFSTKPQPEDPR